MLPALTLVLGGAASGKSAFAEALAEKSGISFTYLATAQAFDAEMRDRIDTHIARRGPGWQTIESPLEAAKVLENLRGDAPCLFDCATLWLSNHMLAGSDLAAAETRLLHALAGCAVPVIVVSNEVGQGIVPDAALGRRFRDAQGRLNIALAAQADLVVQVIAGLPQVLKGTLP